MRYISLTFILAMPSCLLLAQDSRSECLEVVSNAENEFSVGRFYGIPSLLKDCLDKNSFSNEQLVRVYLLLTQVYLLIDDPISAEDSYLKLLKADPEYVSSADKDPIDVVFLSQKFTSTPIFTPHVKGGLIEAGATIIRDRNLFGNSSTVRRTQSNKLGWTIGSGIEWNINDNWGLGGELFFSHKQMGTTYSGIFVDDQLSTIEKQYWLDVPIYVRYTDSKGRIRPYAYAGHAVNFLVNANVEVSYIDFTPTEVIDAPIQVPAEGPDLPMTFNRKLVNRSLVIGGGVKIKSGKDFFTLDLRYGRGMTNVSKGSFYNSDNAGDGNLFEAITRYAMISNDFRVNDLTFTIGYVRPLYDPRKVKKTRNKALSRKMSKEDL